MIISKELLHLYSELFKEDRKEIFPNISTKIKQYILKKLLNLDLNINFNEIDWKGKYFIDSGFYKLNTSRINFDGSFKEDFFQDFFKKFENIKKSLNKDMDFEEDSIIEDIKNKNKLDIIEKDIYKIEKHHNMSDVYEAMFRSEGFCKFRFDFINNGLNKQYPTNITTLQRFEVKINSKQNSYEHLAKLHFRCASCGHEFFKSYKELESTNFKTECTNILMGAEGKPKVCKKALSTPTNISKVVKVNTYDATILGENDVPENILVETMEELEPYIYDAVGFRLQENGDKYLFLLDYIEIEGNKIKKEDHPFKFEKRENNSPDIIPQWFNFFDKKIFELSGNKVLGMYDIKLALLIQKINSIFYKKYNFFELNYNIALLGDNDSGKTWTFEHYGYLLYGGLMKVTNGESISIPSLRGSAKSNRDKKKGNKNVPGLLTQYKNILVDEIDKNPEDIMSSMKPILLKPTFANDKTDGDKTEYTRTAHINITENVSTEHGKIIQGMIRKEYDRLYHDPTFEKNGDEEEIFNNNWDIFQNIESYNNIILKQAIYNIRKGFENNKIHFLDGREHAVHDRFPFWYVMRMTKDAKTIEDRQDSVIEKMLNCSKKECFIAVNKILQELTIDNIDDLFLSLEQFIIGVYDKEDVKNKLKAIIEEYESSKGTVSRIMKTMVMILNCSRILNMRENFSDVDYNYVRRFLYMRDRIVNYDEFNDMNKFNNIITINNNDDESDDFKGFV
jgi:hypothetical protein